METVKEVEAPVEKVTGDINITLPTLPTLPKVSLVWVIVGLVVVLVIFGVGMCYLSPPTDNSGNYNTAANKAITKANTAKNTADKFGESANAKEAEKIEAKRKAEEAGGSFTKAKKKLEGSIDESSKKKPVVISSDNLDERERRLISDLREQQNSNN